MKIGSVEQLGSGSVHVWRATTRELGPWLSDELYTTILSRAEVIRYKAFASTRARQEFLLGRLMIRLVLSHYYSRIAPQQWALAFNEYGKPRATQAPGVDFSLSHSGGAVVLAIAVDATIGIDIETPSSHLNLMELAQSSFSPEEIQTLHPANLAESFFTFWTLKEAYIKARGMGLVLPLDQFTFRIEDRGSTVSVSFTSEIQDEPKRWWFELSEFDKSPVALAVKADGRPAEVVAHDFAELLIVARAA